MWLRKGRLREEKVEKMMGVKLAKYEVLRERERESLQRLCLVSLVRYKCEVMLELCHGIFSELRLFSTVGFDVFYF